MSACVRLSKTKISLENITAQRLEGYRAPAAWALLERKPYEANNPIPQERDPGDIDRQCKTYEGFWPDPLKQRFVRDDPRGPGDRRLSVRLCHCLFNACRYCAHSMLHCHVLLYSVLLAFL